MKNIRWWNRLLTLTGVVSLTVGCLAGCGGGEPDNGSSRPGSQEESQGDLESGTGEASADGAELTDEPENETADTGITFPLAEQVELTIATPDGSVASLADNLPVWEEIQRRTNIKINWDVTASKQYVEVMKLRVGAGGGKLPDIMFLPNGLSLAELGAEGTILPLEDYIADSANIQKAYEQFPNVKALTSADGHIYSVNTLNESAYFAPYSFIIRKDWLDRLNLEVPETIDDWMTVLRAFRDEDANGNGDSGDEVPFSAGGHAWYKIGRAHV